jgi:hypothetical protein
MLVVIWHVARGAISPRHRAGLFNQMSENEQDELAERPLYSVNALDKLWFYRPNLKR